MKNLIREQFSSLNQLIKTLESRPNNRFMQNCYSSEKNGEDFTGTRSYKEAISLLKYGYTQPIQEIKKELSKNYKTMKGITRNIPRTTFKNKVVGYVPNVPNSLKNLPDSMITIEKVNQKRKTMTILYSLGSCCATDEKKIQKAGVALVSAINIVELSGIQTKLELGFMPATKGGDDYVTPTVVIKNFGERFNLQKICFPMIHPSMFRRIGFRYLETCPFSTESFAFGYGCVIGQDILKKIIHEDDPKVFVITTDYIIQNQYSVSEILKEMSVLK